MALPTTTLPQQPPQQTPQQPYQLGDVFKKLFNREDSPIKNVDSVLGDAIGGPIPQTAFGNLEDILNRGGRLDPALINRNLTAIDRDTQQNVERIGTDQARLGYGSGLAEALKLSAQQGGARIKSDYRASEDRAAEDRMRQDIMLFVQSILGPGVDLRAIEAGLLNAKRLADAQKEGALISGASTVGGSYLAGKSSAALAKAAAAKAAANAAAAGITETATVPMLNVTAPQSSAVLSSTATAGESTPWWARIFGGENSAGESMYTPTDALNDILTQWAELGNSPGVMDDYLASVESTFSGAGA